MAFWLPLLQGIGKVGSTALAETGGVSGIMGKAGQAGLGMGKGAGFLERWGNLMGLMGGKPTGQQDYGGSQDVGLGSVLQGLLYQQGNQQQSSRKPGDLLRKIMLNLQRGSMGGPGLYE